MSLILRSDRRSLIWGQSLINLCDLVASMGPTPKNVLWFGGVHGPKPYKCLCFGGIYLVWWREYKRPESALTSRDLESFTGTQSRGVCRPPDPPRLVPGGSAPFSRPVFVLRAFVLTQVSWESQEDRSHDAKPCGIGDYSTHPHIECNSCFCKNRLAFLRPDCKMRTLSDRLRLP